MTALTYPQPRRLNLFAPLLRELQIRIRARRDYLELVGAEQRLLDDVGLTRDEARKQYAAASRRLFFLF